MIKTNESNQQTNILIGPYLIHVLNNKADSQDYILPNNAKKFMETKETHEPETIFNYIINEEDYILESGDNLLSSFDKGPIPYKIYQTSSGEFLWVRQIANKEIQLVYRISEDWRYWRLISDNSNSSGNYSFQELSYIFPYSILGKGGILFHGVVMEWNGKGIIVAAQSGTGKTTHTRMWKNSENALILNGDRALCYRQDNKWYTSGTPWSGSSGEHLNRSVALSVIVILEQDSVNQVTCLSPIQGAFELIKLAFAPPWEQNLMDHALDSIDQMVQNVPILKLSCKPDLDAVRVLKEEIIKMDENLI